jgi:hypothetical protein
MKENRSHHLTLNNVFLFYRTIAVSEDLKTYQYLEIVKLVETLFLVMILRCCLKLCFVVTEILTTILDSREVECSTKEIGLNLEGWKPYNWTFSWVIIWVRI